MRVSKFCHNCMHLTTAKGFPTCALRHAIIYDFPKDSLDMNHGYRAVESCGSSFAKRTSEYYRGKRNLWKPKPAGVAKTRKRRAA